MFEIIRKGLSKLNESRGMFYLLPGAIALVIGIYTFFFDKSLNLFGDVVGPIGIFSALMFSVIFIVVEHFLKRKEGYSSDNDEDVRYLRNYQDFTKDTVALISFSIFLAGWIILLAFILPQIKFESIWWLSIRNFVFSYFLLQYVALIIIVVKDMYAMLIDDTEYKK